MSGRRLTSPTPSLLSWLRRPGLGLGRLGLLVAAFALSACVVEPTEEPDNLGADLGEASGDLEIGQPETPDEEAEDPEQQLGEPQPTPWRTTAEGDGDPTPPDGCNVGVSGTGTAKDDE